MIDILKEAFRNIFSHRVRSFLTIFGVFWGLLILIVLLGAGKGLENGFLGEYADSLEGSLWIEGSLTSQSFGGYEKGRVIQLQAKDVQHLAQVLGSNALIAGEYFSPDDMFVSYEEKFGSFQTVGVTSKYFSVRQTATKTEGRQLNLFDHMRQRKSAYIGTNVKSRLLAEGHTFIGSKILISGVYFTVVGIFYDPESKSEFSNRIYIPIETYQRVFGSPNKYSRVGVVPSTDFSLNAIEAKVKNVLYARHSVAPSDEKAFVFHNILRDVERTKAVFDYISGFIWIVGMGTLISGAVSLGNIMLVSVKERIPEFGIKRAIGASRYQILLLVTLEALIIGVLGGVFGLAFGWLVVKLFIPVITLFGGNAVFFQNPSVSGFVLIGASVTLLLVCCLSTLVPAIRAAFVSPVEAMRS